MPVGEAALVAEEALSASALMSEKAGLTVAQRLGGIQSKLGSFFGKAGGIKPAAGAAGLTFLLSMLADYGLSRRKNYEQTQAMKEALEDPFSLRLSMRENIAERETARAIENARMRKLQREVATQDPKMYAYLHSLVAGDTIPHLGPGEARIGGSALLDPDTLDRAAAHSDLWDDIRGPAPEPQMAEVPDIWED